MIIRICATVLAAALIAQPLGAVGQERDVAKNMSCADFLKAEQASGWSNGVTGSPSADQSSPAEAQKIHDYCLAHPNDNASAAIAQAKPNAQPSSALAPR